MSKDQVVRPDQRLPLVVIQIRERLRHQQEPKGQPLPNSELLSNVPPSKERPKSVQPSNVPANKEPPSSVLLSKELPSSGQHSKERPSKKQLSNVLHSKELPNSVPRSKEQSALHSGLGSNGHNVLNGHSKG